MDIIAFKQPIIGLAVAHTWRGHGSTIFLELGQLAIGRTRRDGTIGNSKGEFTIHVEPNWRVEGKRSIICGSDDTERAIEKLLQRLVGNTVVDVCSIGPLPELQVALSTCVLSTFSACKGQPNWTINRWDSATAMYSQFGKIKFDGGAPNNSFKPTPLRGAA